MSVSELLWVHYGAWKKIFTKSLGKLVPGLVYVVQCIFHYNALNNSST